MYIFYYFLTKQVSFTHRSVFRTNKRAATMTFIQRLIAPCGYGDLESRYTTTNYHITTTFSQKQIYNLLSHRCYPFSVPFLLTFNCYVDSTIDVTHTHIHTLGIHWDKQTHTHTHKHNTDTHTMHTNTTLTNTHTDIMHLRNLITQTNSQPQ